MQGSYICSHIEECLASLLSRFLQRAPVAFLQCSAVNTILECGIQACMLDHKVD